MAEPRSAAASPKALAPAVNAWFLAHARDLPWRADDRTPWQVLLSEVLSQQTQVSRVVPKYLEFVRAWPTPRAMAEAEVGEVLRAWQGLGYPRRALRLHECAVAITTEHGGRVPNRVDELRALPGIGPYTAAAVAVFAYHRRAAVVDTNTRRVLTRALDGREHAGMPSTRRDEELMGRAMPDADAEAVLFNKAIMELGALVCTARAPKCEDCPIAQRCLWLTLGRPRLDGVKKPRQARFEGSERQARGRIMAVLGERSGPVDETLVLAATPDRAQSVRALDSLIADGLAHRTERGIAIGRAGAGEDASS